MSRSGYMKSFWRSRNLFSKRFLAAGGTRLGEPIKKSKGFKRDRLDWMGRFKDFYVLPIHATGKIRT